jgi:hypothetical protein
MCVAPKSGPGREHAIAVDWRDCAWSPRIVVQNRWGEAPDEPLSPLPGGIWRAQAGSRVRSPHQNWKTHRNPVFSIAVLADGRQNVHLPQPD